MSERPTNSTTLHGLYARMTGKQGGACWVIILDHAERLNPRILDYIVGLARSKGVWVSASREFTRTQDGYLGEMERSFSCLLFSLCSVCDCFLRLDRSQGAPCWQDLKSYIRGPSLLQVLTCIIEVPKKRGKLFCQLARLWAHIPQAGDIAALGLYSVSQCCPLSPDINKELIDSCKWLFNCQ